MSRHMVGRKGHFYYIHDNWPLHRCSNQCNENYTVLQGWYYVKDEGFIDPPRWKFRCGCGEERSLPLNWIVTGIEP